MLGEQVVEAAPHLFIVLGSSFLRVGTLSKDEGLTCCFECGRIDLAILRDKVDILVVLVLKLHDVLCAFVPSHHLGMVCQFLLEDNNLACFHVECHVQCLHPLFIERGTMLRGVVGEFLKSGNSRRVGK